MCALADRPLDEVIAVLRGERMPIEDEPVGRTGACFWSG